MLDLVIPQVVKFGLFDRTDCEVMGHVIPIPGSYKKACEGEPNQPTESEPPTSS